MKGMPVADTGISARPLRSLCWCGRREVRIPADDVRAGRTASCGDPDCVGPETDTVEAIPSSRPWAPPTGVAARLPRPVTYDRSRGPGASWTTGDLINRLIGTADARAVARCSRIVNYWRVEGAITPTVRMTSGSGDWVRWSEADIARLDRIWALREQMHAYGMNMPTAVVAEIWGSLVRGETWTMTIEIDAFADARDALTVGGGS